jgi:hypothetical protein
LIVCGAAKLIAQTSIAGSSMIDPQWAEHSGWPN